ncbi:hypothetical protein [Haladaptatus sp. ZSTT2]|uniref:hypothetical protein n=1 Tax=Haladaptatus sp. ZSTT2 TaxID=3120515 RepID=UPI00300ED9EA
MTTATTSRWARRYVVLSAIFLVGWQVSVLWGVPRHTEVLLGVFGFALHMLFGKAYSLVPSYFNRQLAVRWAPGSQFSLTVTGTGSLILASLGVGPKWLAALGAFLWLGGVALFLSALLWTVRGNLTGRETATGTTNTSRRPIDRMANGFVPVALGYLAIGSYETAARYSVLPTLLDGYFPRVTHLLAAGTAALLLFALGFRLLPRFFVASPPRWLVAVVLPAGALGPALLATQLGGGRWFRLGAVIESVAVIGFALAVWTLFARSDRRRVGFYGVLAGTAAGVLGVLLGLSFAFGHLTAELVTVHLRVNVLGFLGLSIIGVAYQFYPPAVGQLPGVSNRSALFAIGAIAGGLVSQLIGVAGHVLAVTVVGEGLTALGALVYAYVLGAVFHARPSK